MDQCWLIVNLNIINKIEWTLTKDTNIFYQANASKIFTKRQSFYPSYFETAAIFDVTAM